MAELVSEARAAAPVEAAQRIVLRPRAVDDAGFTVATDTDDDGRTRYLVRGERPLRWVRQTDFSNDEAVGYLGGPAGPARRRAGPDRGRRRRGGRRRRSGPTRTAWCSTSSRPSPSGSYLSGPRGSDDRLYER